MVFNRKTYRFFALLIVLLYLGSFFLYSINKIYIYLYYITSLFFLLLICINFLIIRNNNNLLDKPIIIKKKYKIYNIDKLVLAIFFIYSFISLYINKNDELKDYLFYALLSFFCLSLFKINKR